MPATWQAGQAGGYALQGLSGIVGPKLNVDEVQMLMIARAVTGIFGSTQPLAQRYIEDVANRAECPRFLALLTTITTLGQIFGFGLGAGMYEFSSRTPMLVCCVIMCFGLVMTFAFLDEPATFDDWERKMRALQASTGSVSLPDSGTAKDQFEAEFDSYEGPELSERGKDRQTKLYALLCQLMYWCCFIHRFTSMGFITILGCQWVAAFLQG